MRQGFSYSKDVILSDFAYVQLHPASTISSINHKLITKTLLHNTMFSKIISFNPNVKSMSVD